MTFGSPLVMVPVLSKATICTVPVSWRDSAVLNRMPFFAPIPLPTMMATGVARPRAQGQETTSTEMPRWRDRPMSPPLRISQMTVTAAAMAMTTGTNTPEMVSASLATGALVEAASLTMLISWARVVSSPTRVARHLRKPLWFSVAEVTVSPSALSTGMLSPVSADSLTALAPSTTTPSTGMFSPGRTTKMSPLLTSSMPTVISSPFRMTLAVFGASFIRLFSASVVRPLE